MSPPPDALLTGEAAADVLPAAAPAPADVATTAQTQVKPKERYVYLDAMKGVMILWGIPVHACVVSDSKFFHLVSDVSNCVRMEAFFMISGFLSYMLIKRYGAGTIMRKRTIATGIPLLSVALLLNPITNWLILQYHAHKASVAAPGLAEFFTGRIPAEFYAEKAGTWNWHLHIWFLIVLLCLAAFSGPIISVLDRAKVTLRSLASRLPDWLLLSLTGAVAVLCCVAARMGYEVALKPVTSSSFHYPLRMVGYYFAFFALGMAMFASPRLLKLFTRVHWVQLACAGVFLWAARLWLGGFDKSDHSALKKLAEVMNLSAEVYLAVVFVPVLFTFFKRFCSGTTGTMRLSALHWVQLVSSSVLLFAATGLQHLLPSGVEHWSQLNITAPAFVEQIGLTPALLSLCLMQAVQGYFFVMVCLVLFGLFERFIKSRRADALRRGVRVLRLPFHYLVIYLNAFWLRDWVGIKDGFTLSLLVTLFTTAITMLIYEYAVSRNTVLKCLFLGKIPKKEKATA